MNDPTTMSLSRLVEKLAAALKEGGDRPVFMMDPESAIRLPISNASVEVEAECVDIWSAIGTE